MQEEDKCAARGYRIAFVCPGREVLHDIVDLVANLLHGRMDTFGESLWSVIDRATDPNTHPKASGDYDPWRRPDPRREYVLSVAFANQVGDAIMVRGADARRRRNRSGGRYATGARA